MKKKILITGATGFIGSHLLKALKEAKQGELYVLARQPGNMPGVHWIQGDLERPDFVDRLPSEYDILIHLAQYRNHRSFPEESKTMFQVNVASFLALLDHARLAGVSRVISTSSANVYALSSRLISEDDALETIDFYAMNKGMAEQILHSYRDYFEICNLRLFTVYGPGQRNRLIPRLIQSVHAGQVITLSGGTGISISPVFIDDLIGVMVRLMKIPFERSLIHLNVGGRESVTIRQIADKVGILLQKEPFYQEVEGISGIGWCADIEELRRIVPEFSPVSMNDGLTVTCHELMKNPDQPA